jgi:hypothetical protein
VSAGSLRAPGERPLADLADGLADLVDKLLRTIDDELPREHSTAGACALHFVASDLLRASARLLRGEHGAPAQEQVDELRRAARRVTRPEAPAEQATT